jgi:hypothetical protein
MRLYTLHLPHMHSGDKRMAATKRDLSKHVAMSVETHRQLSAISKQRKEDDKQYCCSKFDIIAKQVSILYKKEIKK